MGVVPSSPSSSLAQYFREATIGTGAAVGFELVEVVLDFDDCE